MTPLLSPILEATEPPEARGVARDRVRLLVAGEDGIAHAHFADLPRFLRAGDLLVVNTSATLAAAVDARWRGGDVVVHVATALDDGRWVVELRSSGAKGGPVWDALPGERVRLRSGSLVLESSANGRLWRARADLDLRAYLNRHGRPIRYSYVPRQWPLADYQTVFALEPGSAEMPSAARPFSAALVTRLVSQGVAVAPVTLHTGVSSPEQGEPPQPERFAVPETTARLVNLTRSSGGRVVAVGTTATRALESSARDGVVLPARGWTDLVLGPGRPAYLVDGLVTGWHAPGASHLHLLEAVAGEALVRRAYDEALRERYLWHEFGDSCLLLPPRLARPTATPAVGAYSLP